MMMMPIISSNDNYRMMFYKYFESWNY